MSDPAEQATSEEAPAFSHPIEAEFARILDYYGVAWQYEPRTFALKWDAEGRMTVAFTPDFYLPDQDLFVELTTMRPRLITKKNGKIRRLRELHPEINIQLWKRSDLRDFMLRFGLDSEASRIMGTAAQDDNNQ